MGQSKLPRVAVLMSTYNGEKFIEQQIDSIESQCSVEIHIFIRDDGSSDSTISLISDLNDKYHNISLMVGNNLGFADSFYTLMQRVSNYDYYCLADQDDVWDNNKIIEGIKFLDDEVPCLYYSNLYAFNQYGERYYILDNAFVESNYSKYFYVFNGYGCTMLWNEKLQDIVHYNIKPQKITHDIWLNLLANIYGKCIYGGDGHINYRIHSSNARGATPRTKIDKIKKIYKYYFENKNQLCIAENCKYIIDTFEYYDPLAISLANYKSNKIKAINAIINMTTSGYQKRKLILLVVFNKL